MEAWRGHSPSALSKEGQRERRYLFSIHHRCSRQIFGVRRIFPEFPQTCSKNFFVQLLPKNFFHKIMNTSFSWNLQKKVFRCFYVNLGCHFLKSNNVGRHFYPDFQGFCQGFRQIKTFGGALATPSPPSPTPLLFITVSWIISWFIKIDLKQI